MASNEEIIVDINILDLIYWILNYATWCATNNVYVVFLLQGTLPPKIALHCAGVKFQKVVG